MHCGSIHNPETKEGRLYAHLRDNPGQWFSGWDLLQVINTTAVSTFLSSVRAQLPDGEWLERESRRQGRQSRNFYRLVLNRQPEQQLLFK